MSPDNAELTSLIGLKPTPDVKNEPKTIWFNGDLVESSRFGTMQFLEVLQLIGFSREALIKTYIAYQDLKQYCNYKGEDLRTSGEATYHHGKGVALIDILEFDSKDPEKTIAEVMHDGKEDSHTMLGTEDHPSRQRFTHEVITTEEVLAMRYHSREVARLILAVSKPRLPKDNMTKSELEAFKFTAFGKVLTLFPELRIKAAQMKTCDRLMNNRSLPLEKKPEWSAGKVLETYRFIDPIARVAGEKYHEKIMRELKEFDTLLTPQQKAEAKPVDYNIN
jgi:hypothetical protein